MLTTVQTFLLRNRFSLATATLGLLFAAASLLPHALQRLDREYPFQGIEIMAADAENFYAARVREVYDGYWSVGNAYYSDLKDAPFAQPPLPEIVVAVVSMVLRIDPVTAFVLMKGIFSFFLGLVLVGAFRSLTGRTWEVLLAVALLLFANALLNAPWDLPAILRGELSPGILRFARPINPQWPALWFFADLWLLSEWIKKRSIVPIIGMGLVTLLLLYSYVYAWTYIGVTFDLLFFYFLWKRDWPRVRDLLLLGGIVAAGGIPYLVHLWHTIHHPWYADSAMRQGLVHKRELVLGVWVLFFVAFSFLTKKLWPQTWPLVPALAVGGLIALNHQLITNAYLVPHHYYWYFIQPLASVTAIIALLSLARRFIARPMFIAAGCIVLAGALLLGFAQEQWIYRDQRSAWGDLQKAAPLFAFFNDRAAPGTVVTGVREGFIDEYVPIYTAVDTYATLYANLFLLPKSRAQDTFFFRLWLEGITPEETEERFFTDLRLKLSSALYAIYYREAIGDFAGIPEEDIRENIAAYRTYYDTSLESKLSKYPLNMIVLEQGDPETPAIQELKTIGKVIFKDEFFTVIELET